MISLPSLLLHALKHVLWAMANANSSDAPIIKMCMCVCGGGGGGWTEEGMWECNARFIVSTCSQDAEIEKGPIFRV